MTAIETKELKRELEELQEAFSECNDKMNAIQEQLAVEKSNNVKSTLEELVSKHNLKKIWIKLPWRERKSIAYKYIKDNRDRLGLSYWEAEMFETIGNAEGCRYSIGLVREWAGNYRVDNPASEARIELACKEFLRVYDSHTYVYVYQAE